MKAAIPDKVGLLSLHLRRLWPKYDEPLNQYVESKQMVLNIITHCFEAAGLKTDFDNLMHTSNLYGLIGDEGGEQFSQPMIINVIKRFYGDSSSYIPIKKNPKNLKKSPGGDKRPKTSVATGNGTYADHYARVKELANEKKWP